ncbi:MAG: hypothetical protein H0U52_00640 [Chloroflexi bacterium]|nr:hypothetical protein [Chloroflexota bacterium]
MTLNLPAIADKAEASPVAADAPVAADIAPRVRVCPECSGEFHPPVKGPGQHKRFCADKCRSAWAAREKAEGAVLITVARIWRKTRGAGEIGKRAFEEMTSILDKLNAKHSEEGRYPLNATSPVADYVRDVLAVPYMDRERSYLKRKA